MSLSDGQQTLTADERGWSRMKKR